MYADAKDGKMTNSRLQELRLRRMTFTEFPVRSELRIRNRRRS